MKKAVQFGAGNIGRGFLGQLFTKSGYEVVFIDIDKQLVAQLNKRGSYPLHIVGDRPYSITIDGVRAVDLGDARQVVREVESADIVATAVGNKALKAVAPFIRRALERRKDYGTAQPLNVIICENLLNAGYVLRSYVREGVKTGYYDYVDDHLGCVEAVVSRMIPIMTDEDKKDDPLIIRAEEYDILPVNKKGFKGEIPDIKGMVPHDNFEALVEQKLFIHNLGHAMFAYLGYLEGHTFIREAIKNRKINEIAEGALKESGEALNKKHDFTPEEQQAHIDDLIRRFSGKALGDTVFRVARDPIRKLGANDRLVGAAKLAREYGVVPENICAGIAAALCYSHPKDLDAVRLQQDITARGVDWVLEAICDLRKGSDLAGMIKEKYHKLTEK